jgi:hypothetical protein
MVANNERCVESIRESLRRMGEFFGEDSPSVDRATLAGIERDLVRMENTLRLFSQYGRPDAVSRRP